MYNSNSPVNSCYSPKAGMTGSTPRRNKKSNKSSSYECSFDEVKLDSNRSINSINSRIAG